MFTKKKNHMKCFPRNGCRTGCVEVKAVESMVEVYYNQWSVSAYTGISGSLAKMHLLFESLGAFYEKKGYSDSHSRMRRYEILLQYLQEETDVSVESVTEDAVRSVSQRN